MQFVEGHNMNSVVTPNSWVVLRLQSERSRVIQVIPNNIISVGKHGTFAANSILFRPHNLTYELLDRKPGVKDSDLRIVPASELHADVIAEETAATSAANGSSDVLAAGDGVEFQLVGENGEVIMRSNRETIDDSARQTLTMEEIEELKREGTGAGKDLIAKLMLSHTGLDEKTSFSLAKYKLLKTKKYLKRFTVLPLDVANLTQWLIDEKEASKVLEIREETLSLIGSWSNIHFAEDPTPGTPSGRWLVVDETGGLIVAAMAERMGTLHREYTLTALPKKQSSGEEKENRLQEIGEVDEEDKTEDIYDRPLATSNTLTLVHTNAQPNLSLLTYFNYHPNSPAHPSSYTHPLASHLHPLSWLQLISPSSDSTYSSPPQVLPASELADLKPGKRGTYYRKQRRYNRARSIIDNTRAGGFDGLVVASAMDPVSIMKNLVPLLRGGAQVVVYSPTIEPLSHLADMYSTSRRTAFIQSPPEKLFTKSASSAPPTDASSPQSQPLNSSASISTNPESELTPSDSLDKPQDHWPGTEDFPLNPTLLLNVTVHTTRVNKWQVLPGRTHPLMTCKGGAEGYVFTATRVLPAEGRVEARGKWGKRKRDDDLEKQSALKKNDVGEMVMTEV
ncbi:Gcd10p family-domain-containing protein [Bisporella sp. PMI_857]|nr:Gcd10p family-domain-containing protein [Bisporella sp. PMI_857]